jgi:hypothetical protein
LAVAGVEDGTRAELTGFGQRHELSSDEHAYLSADWHDVELLPEHGAVAAPDRSWS